MHYCNTLIASTDGHMNDSRTGIIVKVQQIAISSNIAIKLFLGRQGLLVYIDTAIMTHTRLTTITCMRTFCSILPVGSRSRLRSYNTYKCALIVSNRVFS